MLSILLYVSESWTPLKKHLQKLNSFYNRCLPLCLGICITSQWENHISNETIRQRWGDPDTMNIKLIRRRMQWLGHLAQMPNHRIPKMCFFGWLSEKRPQDGPKKRWKDIIRNLNDLNIPESCWYDLANISSSAWRDHYHACLESSQVSSGIVDLQTVVCPECHRGFRRICDLKRHKCIAEREKPIHQQKGAIECQTCKKYF